MFIQEYFTFSSHGLCSISVLLTRKSVTLENKMRKQFAIRSQHFNM